MRAVLLAFALLPGLTFAAHAANDDELTQQMVGKWGENAACAAGALQFNADGTFFGLDQSGAETLKGTFDITGGKLHGKTADGGSMPEMTVSFEAETLVLTGTDSPTQRLTRCTA